MAVKNETVTKEVLSLIMTTWAVLKHIDTTKKLKIFVRDIAFLSRL